ncbi:SRPBCC domain-containing protein [Antrihabitans sp. YC3-6]|uniref:SRPBCC domain-containing protein n=1 Tax=Antrihabitans stalagmiti TaxID=2799499 RepID=A0A934U1Z1_9NOCA|nr:SRPBCC domain-containing protein [Antrihabitans stalagmiti]MBJ8337803.1 SRPBCC domain-containing protein [Antrihabitans stalagmiti]
MVDILHRIATATSSPDAVYQALSTRDGLAAWWTTETTGDTEVGGVLQFRFDAGGFDMKVVELVPSVRVLWEVIDGPEEWVGTTVNFDLTQDGDWTVVNFTHAGWKEPVEFMHHCSTKWATFLLSMKALVETGKGTPAPDDVKVSNWH